MHLTPSDPDISTLIRKIKSERLDLQPNFQRGEVWGMQKKQRLIDSILRGWHIPPVHVIESENSSKQEVLDGQQRLAAIRDFLDDEFAIYGDQDPVDQYIVKLNGKRWSDLSPDTRSKIEDFTIRVLTISDYKPGEPGELFYRLNQPTNLTAAEQRNAYFGEARQQVKEISEKMIELGFSRGLIGFSNSRMAYDDVIAKFILTLEQGTLKKKITANTVTSRYRNSVGFSSELIRRTELALNRIGTCLIQNKSSVKLNKATLYSWLIFSDRFERFIGDVEFLQEFFQDFENIKEDLGSVRAVSKNDHENNRNIFTSILRTYQDRASSRVADTTSVILRDLALWLVYTLIFTNGNLVIEGLRPLYDESLALLAKDKVDADELSRIAKQLDWGDSL